MENTGTYFCDVSRLGKIRISGESASEFIKVMTTVELRKIETPGEAALALVLDAEGEIIDVIMVARTGQHEYMLISHEATRGELTEWLQAHAEIKDSEGAPVFEDIKVEDRTASIATFALYGPAAQMILTELSKTDVSKEFGDKNITLITVGELQVMVIRWPLLRAQGYKMPLMSEGEVFEVYLPVKAGSSFEEILLGFSEIDPECYEDYVKRRKAAHTWFSAAEDAAYIKPTSEGLKALMRSSADFVGAKALEKQGILTRQRKS